MQRPPFAEAARQRDGAVVGVSIPVKCGNEAWDTTAKGVLAVAAVAAAAW